MEISYNAEWGHAWIVDVEYNTEADGTQVPEGEPGPHTLHGPFDTEAEAVEWLQNYPEDTDVYDITLGVINKVEPKVTA